jgi:hypothetical protein
MGEITENEVPKDEGTREQQSNSTSIPSSPYSNIKREITEEDLKSPAVQRILLSEVDKLEKKNVELDEQLRLNQMSHKTLQTEFHEIDKKKEILEEKFKTSKSQEILYSFCLTSGSIMIGLAKIVWEHGLGALFISIGFFLIIGGIISKAIKWK